MLTYSFDFQNHITNRISVCFALFFVYLKRKWKWDKWNRISQNTNVIMLSKWFQENIRFESNEPETCTQIYYQTHWKPHIRIEIHWQILLLLLCKRLFQINLIAFIQRERETGDIHKLFSADWLGILCFELKFQFEMDLTVNRILWMTQLFREG